MNDLMTSSDIHLKGCLFDNLTFFFLSWVLCFPICFWKAKTKQNKYCENHHSISQNIGLYLMLSNQSNLRKIFLGKQIFLNSEFFAHKLCFKILRLDSFELLIKATEQCDQVSGIRCQAMGFSSVRVDRGDLYHLKRCMRMKTNWGRQKPSSKGG